VPPATAEADAHTDTPTRTEPDPPHVESTTTVEPDERSPSAVDASAEPAPDENTDDAGGRGSAARPAGPATQPRPRPSSRSRAGMRPSSAARTETRRPGREPAPRTRRQEREASAAGRRGWAQIVVLVLVIVLLGAFAAVFRGQAERASTGAANNRAVIDTGANTEVVGQISKAVETVLSYDHTKLDENERAAREVITGKYVDEYNVTFADIRKTATEQKVTLTTTVLLAGVKHLSGDRAELIATMDLASTRDGAPANAPGRVRVVANRVDGRWKIAEMTLL
jgi:Mce-associated membrane protein